MPMFKLTQKSLAFEIHVANPPFDLAYETELSAHDVQTDCKVSLLDHLASQ